SVPLLPPRVFRARVQGAACLGPTGTYRLLAGDGEGDGRHQCTGRTGHVLHHQLVAVARPLRTSSHAVGSAFRGRSLLRLVTSQPMVTLRSDQPKSVELPAPSALPVRMDAGTDGDYLAVPSIGRPR